MSQPSIIAPVARQRKSVGPGDDGRPPRRNRRTIVVDRP